MALATFSWLQSVPSPAYRDGLIAGAEMGYSRVVGGSGSSGYDPGIRWAGRVGWRRAYERSAIVVDASFDGVGYPHHHPGYQSFDEQDYYRIMFGVRGEIRTMPRLVLWFAFRLGFASYHQAGVDCPFENFCHDGAGPAVDALSGLNVEILRWLAAGPFIAIGVPGGVPEAGLGLTFAFP